MVAPVDWQSQPQVVGEFPKFHVNAAQAHGIQIGDNNQQFNIFSNGFERLTDVIFDPAILVRDLDLAHFTGRARIIEQIDAFLGSRRRGYVVVQGEAGVGKSTLAAHLAMDPDRKYICHFTLLPGGRSPESARKNLAAQLIVRWGLTDFAPGGILPATAGRSDWFDRVLQSAARRRDGREPDTRIVLVVDGLDEADTGGTAGSEIPMDLPGSLPDGVYVIATTRPGIDRALAAIRNPAEWMSIDVEGHENLDDVTRFLSRLTRPGEGDPLLLARLDAAHVAPDRFARLVADRCNGVWIYLKYVLDEIREGGRVPADVASLPEDLVGFYARQLHGWRDDSRPSGTDQWLQIRLPLLAILAAAREPLPLTDLVFLGGISSQDSAFTFLSRTARAFLSHEVTPGQPGRWALRHQSLRDFIEGHLVCRRADFDLLQQELREATASAHLQIANALIPPGVPQARDWRKASLYARSYLPYHAQVSGMLDDLVQDAGFLCTVEAEALLRCRAGITSSPASISLEAFELSLAQWPRIASANQLEWLRAWAARTKANSLLATIPSSAMPDWRILWAAWQGAGHGKLTGHADDVRAIAIGKAGDRDVIVSASSDKTVRIWDAVTGEPIGEPLTGHAGGVVGVALGRAGDRDVIVSASSDKTVRIWDAVTGQPIGQPLRLTASGGDTAVAFGRAGQRDVIVLASNRGTTGTSRGTSVGDATISICDPVTMQLIRAPLTIHERGVQQRMALAYDPRQDIFFCVGAADDHTIRVWAAITGRAIGRPIDAPDVEALAMGRIGDRNIIVSSHYNQPTRFWDVFTGEQVRPPATHDYSPSALATGHVQNRDVIVCGCRDYLEVWGADAGQAGDNLLVGHTDTVISLACGRVEDRDVIVSGAAVDDETVWVWDATTGRSIGNGLTPVLGAVDTIAVGRAGNRDVVITADYDRSQSSDQIRIWDPVTGARVGDPMVGHRKVAALALGRVGDRDVIVSAGTEGAVRFWDALTCKPIGDVLAVDDSRPRAIALGKVSNRRTISCAGALGNDAIIHTWDAISGQLTNDPVIIRDAGLGAIGFGCVIGRECIVCMCGDDGTVRTLDVVTGQPAGQPFKIPGGRIFSLAVGRIAKHDVIVSGGADATVRLWDALTGRPIGRPLIGHSGSVCVVALSRADDRDIIISGGEDRTVIVWTTNESGLSGRRASQ